MIRIIIGVVLVIIGIIREAILHFRYPDSLPARIIVDNTGYVVFSWILILIGIALFYWGFHDLEDGR